MVANMGPAAYNYDESVTTLRYANRAKNIKNKPKVNEDPKDALLREFQEEIGKLKVGAVGRTGLTVLAPPPPPACLRGLRYRCSDRGKSFGIHLSRPSELRSALGVTLTLNLSPFPRLSWRPAPAPAPAPAPGRGGGTGRGRALQAAAPRLRQRTRSRRSPLRTTYGSSWRGRGRPL